MTAVTLKNIPDELYEAIKQAAKSHHRSINSEIIVNLHQAFLPKQISVAEKLANIRRVRAEIPAKHVTDDIIDAAINEGRL